MGRVRTKSDYEEIRNARIMENQPRMASLGLDKSICELRAIISSAKSIKTPAQKERKKPVYSCTTLRRSNRLKGKSCDPISKSCSLRRSDRLKGKSGDLTQEKLCLSRKNRKGLFCKVKEEEEEEWKRPANAPLLSIDASILRLSPVVLARRCDSKSRGSVYDPVFGICCHFCRQKKLCGEEDCKRCGNLELDQPCLGKTDCSVCHSSYGVLCRACLKVRYGEEMEEVRENKDWMCPHCIEEKGINPYWICNSSLCLKKRKMVPTGIAIYKAREEGYLSVAHLLMDELQRAAKNRRGG